MKTGYDGIITASIDIKNEEDTKQAMVIPVLNKLGYDIGFNTKIRYEYHVNDEGNGKKVDIALPINDDGIDPEFVPKVFVEVKPVRTWIEDYYIQLEDYLESTPYIVLGVITNGFKYHFFHTNFELDSLPFFTINFAWPVEDYEMNTFTKLLGKESSSEEIEQLVTKLKLMSELKIKIANDTNNKLSRIIKTLPKESITSSAIELAIDLLDRYFTDEDIKREFGLMNQDYSI